MESKVTTAIILDTRRSKMDNTYPVKLRLTYKRKRKYFGLTGYSFTQVDFKRITGDKPRAEFKELKMKLSLIEQKAMDVINGLPAFTFQQFERRFFNKTGTGRDLFLSFELHIEHLKKNGHVGTTSVYIAAKKSLETFYYNRTKLSFQDITPEFLQKYENWMLGTGKSPTTVGIYLRCVRQLYNEAIRNDNTIREDYPFGRDKYQIPHPRNIKKALPLSDIARIFRYEPEKNSPEHYYRDLWIFSYLCNGMNLKDICLLKYGYIHGEYIHFRRAKTEFTNRNSKPIDVYMTDEVKEIIEHWGCKPVFPDNYIFPVLTDRLTPDQVQKKVKQATKQCNKYIKQVAGKIGITGNISSYSARHSFATVLKRSGASVEFISEQLGHTSVETTAGYLDSFEDEQKKEMAGKLTAFENTES